LVVRSILVTALNLDIGDAIWWPNHPPSRRAPAIQLGSADHTLVSV
jgi:hypothetical protein